MLLYQLNFEVASWVGEPNPESPSVRDKYTLAIMRLVKQIYDHKAMTPTVSKALSNVLLAMGFSEYIEPLDAQYSGKRVEDRPLTFELIKLVKLKTKIPVHNFMQIVEDPIVWQLRLFGEFMDRSMDGKPDHRVAFEPDAWQRDVLDCIDKERSLLVVGQHWFLSSLPFLTRSTSLAPTSAGKTFISYYAMEKVLRDSDDGILVYVAPTKTLVAQIAAEIYARFKKDVKGGLSSNYVILLSLIPCPGSCWAIHTRDYRIHNPQKCQILVTVPEMLAIMLLSPPLARVWTPRIKRRVT
jgi:hypothetical protein